MVNEDALGSVAVMQGCSREMPGHVLCLKVTEQTSDCEDRCVPDFRGSYAPASEFSPWRAKENWVH